MASVPPPSRLRRWTVTTLKLSLYALVVATVALLVAVAVAGSQLPSCPGGGRIAAWRAGGGVGVAGLRPRGGLARRKILGQRTGGRPARGAIIQSMGRLFGKGLPCGGIPPVMRDAMTSVEDRRF